MVDSWVFVTYHSLMDLWDHYKWPYKLITGVITPTSFVFEKMWKFSDYELGGGFLDSFHSKLWFIS